MDSRFTALMIISFFEILSYSAFGCMPFQFKCSFSHKNRGFKREFSSKILRFLSICISIRLNKQSYFQQNTKTISSQQVDYIINTENRLDDINRFKNSSNGSSFIFGWSHIIGPLRSVLLPLLAQFSISPCLFFFSSSAWCYSNSLSIFILSISLLSIHSLMVKSVGISSLSHFVINNNLIPLIVSNGPVIISLYQASSLFNVILLD